MELARGFHARGLNKANHSLNREIGWNSDAVLVIKLPDARVLRILSRSMFLAMVILTLPCIGSMLRGISSTPYVNVSTHDYDLNLIDFEFLDLLLRDLANEGLIKKSDKALIIGGPQIRAVIGSLRFLNANGMDPVLESDLEQASRFPNANFDFVFTFGFEDIRSVDRIVKVGGIVVTQLNNSLSNDFQKQSNYRVLYLRRYNSTIVAMKKTNLANESVDTSPKRRLCRFALEAKKVALKGLEDVLLEPPRKALAKSRKILHKFHYLPDLLEDSLENYPRRVFIDVGTQEAKSSVTTWFNGNYPTRNQEFEVYNIPMVPEERSKMEVPAFDVSSWLMKNVKEDEFVVMKADAEVVEDMIEKRTIALVDELFLECNNQWHSGEGMKKSKRAYWECLALYGRLRDEAIAVHQWWG